MTMTIAHARTLAISETQTIPLDSAMYLHVLAYQAWVWEKAETLGFNGVSALADSIELAELHAL